MSPQYPQIQYVVGDHAKDPSGLNDLFLLFLETYEDP